MSREVAPAGPARASEPIPPDRRPFDRRAAILFALACATSLTVLSVMGSHLTFFLDDWDFLLFRHDPGWHAVLEPHNEHLSMMPVLIYEALLHGFGMDSLLPFSFVADFVAVAAVVALFVWLRHRIGDWLALAAALPILFLGTGAEDLLFPFQIGYFGSLAFGIGALLALERDEPRFDRVACLSVVVSLSFSSVGLAFLLGAGVWVALDERRVQRAYVAGVPAVLYALWWAGWGHHAQTHITLSAIATSPSYVLDGLASSLSSLLGLAVSRSDSEIAAPDWGRALFVVALALVGWRLLRGPRPGRSFWVVLAIAIGYWGLAAWSAYVEARAPSVGRYQFPGVVFLVMVIAELIRGIRLSQTALIAVFAVVAIATAANLSRLSSVYDAGRTFTELVRSDLAAIEFARGNVADDLTLTTDNAGTSFVPIQAGPYLSTVRAFGSPAFSEAQLLAAPERVRRFADTVSAAANGLATDRTPGAPSRAGTAPVLVGSESTEARRQDGCLTLGSDAGFGPVIDLPPGGVAIINKGEGAVSLGLRRWAGDVFPIEAGAVAPGSSVAIDIPADGASRPWQLQARSAADLDLMACGLVT